MSGVLYRWLVFGTLAVYWLGIFIATHLPTLPEAVDLSQISDKTLHFGAYAGLGFLLSASVAAVWNWSFLRAAAVLLSLSLYGVADELLQIPMNRTADVADWQADVLGGVTGVAAFSVVWAIFWRLTNHRPAQRVGE